MGVIRKLLSLYVIRKLRVVYVMLDFYFIVDGGVTKYDNASTE